MKKRRKMMMKKKNRQLCLKPRCVVLLSTLIAQSGAAEAPKVQAAVSTAWCRTLRWKLCAHTHEAPALAHTVEIVIRQQGASGGSSSAGESI